MANATRQLTRRAAAAIERLRKRAQLSREQHESANRLDPEAVRFFSRHYRPAAVGLVGTNDAVGRAIREAQKDITADGQPSLWSHCFLLGDIRTDRRGPNGALSRSVYILESDLHADRSGLQLRNGAQENWVGKWCVERVEHAAVLRFPTTLRQRRLILATALQLAGEQLLYPVAELLGTWLAIGRQRRWQANPLLSPHALYCSSFVRHCYREAGYDPFAADVALSNTAPEDIARAGVQSGTLVRLR
ncbi:hypothetical protein JXD38_05170 [candidate division WOR-3 bacterium]|nr:hypothetical protein [candidate division WOR-3 bacterium]